MQREFLMRPRSDGRTMITDSADYVAQKRGRPLYNDLSVASDNYPDAGGGPVR
jgi:hypothetical protein